MKNLTIQSMLGNYSLNSIIVYHKGEAISFKELLSDVIYLEQLLPEHLYLLNLYEDRYYFLLGLLLGIKRDSTHLFPSNTTAHTIEHLYAVYPKTLVLTDDALNYKNKLHLNLEKLLNIKSDKEFLLHDTDIVKYFHNICFDKLRVIIFTSGSTGKPKAFKKTWGDFIDVATQLGQQLKLNKDTAILATVPAQHMYGLEASIMMPLVNGLAIHAERPFYPADIETILSKSLQKKILITTPIHLRACLKTQVNLFNLEFCISATAPLNKELAQSFEKTQQSSIIEIYGCTEVGVIATRKPAHSEHWYCLNDIELKQNSDGDVLLLTSRSIQKFILNDHVSELKNNTFILDGRKEDIVNIAGKRCSLSYLNYHLLNIEQVEDACFYQIDAGQSPDKHDIIGNQQRLVVFVACKKDCDALKDLINKALAKIIEPVFMPRYYYFIDSLPRNKTGKLLYNDMKELYQRELKRKKYSE
ncbi:MAG: acyl-CoA synthetase [Proteobacteria bacterium]|nr:acyl-CoA synthetase [Pseudomonadota bacterium]